MSTISGQHRVRTVASHIPFRVESYNYMFLFRAVKKTINQYIKQKYPRELYPNSRRVLSKYIFGQQTVIFNDFLVFASELINARGGVIDPQRGSLFIIGFTLWYGFGLRFPKHLKRKTFQHIRCISFLNVATNACNVIIRTYGSEHSTNSEVTIAIMEKLKKIFSYSIV